MDKDDGKKVKNSFSDQVKKYIKLIPKGKVATYGQIALYAGNFRAARQVSWILHSCSKKDNLPWHRVISSKGNISLPIHRGYHVQKTLLEKEGILFDDNDSIDLDVYLWNISD